jgi:hypothetical protein
MNAQVTRLLTRKTALGETRVEEQREEISRAEPEVLAQIKSFAITTNNITYAAFGDSMRYWQFFPSGQPEWGQMPVWGFADIVASNVPGVAVGERFYGYFPIASHLRMRPERVTQRGFYDGAGHRKDLTSAYNQYTRCSADPAYAADLESYQMLFRPLFLTSFMLADFLQDNGFFGASQLIVSSASSKTAYGTAFCLQDSEDVDLVGLTSARHRTFVERLGCYGRVAEYDAISRLAGGSPTLYVDFSGDEALRAAVHRQFGAALVYDCYVGSAQNTHFLRDQKLPGPEPKFFFAPVQIKKRNADWGPQEVNRRFHDAQRRFLDRVRDSKNPWIEVVETRGFDAARQLIAELADGRAEPQRGHVVRLA